MEQKEKDINVRKGLVQRKIIDKARKVTGEGERQTRMHCVHVSNCQRKSLIIKEEEKFIHQLLESLDPCPTK